MLPTRYITRVVYERYNNNIIRATINPSDASRGRKKQVYASTLSSPFSYRLLHKTHERAAHTQSSFLRSSRIRRRRDQHRGADPNLDSISPRLFLTAYVAGKAGPNRTPDQTRPDSLSETSREDPADTRRGPLWHMSPSRCCDFGPDRLAHARGSESECVRVRVAHTQASDTAVTNDIVEPAYSRPLSLHLAVATTAQVLSGPRMPAAWSVPRQHLVGRPKLGRRRGCRGRVRGEDRATGQYFRRGLRVA